MYDLYWIEIKYHFVQGHYDFSIDSTTDFFIFPYAINQSVIYSKLTQLGT